VFIIPLLSLQVHNLRIAPGAMPILYSILLAIRRRRIDRLVLLSAVAFSIACVVSLLAGGSSLPLKLSDAMITFVIGMVLLVAALIRRPAALGQLLPLPFPTKQIDGSLGPMIGPSSSYATVASARSAACTGRSSSTAFAAAATVSSGVR